MSNLSSYKINLWDSQEFDNENNCNYKQDILKTCCSVFGSESAATATRYVGVSRDGEVDALLFVWYYSHTFDIYCQDWC